MPNNPLPEEPNDPILAQIVAVSKGPNALDMLADLDDALRHSLANSAEGSQESASAQRARDFLDSRIATAAHAFAYHLRNDLSEESPREVQRILVSVAQRASAADNNMETHQVRLGAFREALRGPAGAPPVVLRGQPAWDYFKGFVAAYRPAVLPTPEQMTSVAGRDLLERIAAAHDIPTLSAIAGEIGFDMEAEEGDFPGAPAPYDPVRPSPEDRDILFASLRTRSFDIFNTAYLQGLRVEGTAGAAEAIYVKIQPDPLLRIQEPNPVLAQGEEIRGSIPRLLDIVEQAENPVAGDGAPGLPDGLPNGGNAPRRTDQPAAAAITPPAEPAFPPNEMSLDLARQALLLGARPGISLLEMLDVPNARRSIEEAINQAIQRLERGERGQNR